MQQAAVDKQESFGNLLGHKTIATHGESLTWKMSLLVEAILALVHFLRWTRSKQPGWLCPSVSFKSCELTSEPRASVSISQKFLFKVSLMVMVMVMRVVNVSDESLYMVIICCEGWFDGGPAFFGMFWQHMGNLFCFDALLAVLQSFREVVFSSKDLFCNGSPSLSKHSDNDQGSSAAYGVGRLGFSWTVSLPLSRSRCVESWIWMSSPD